MKYYEALLRKQYFSLNDVSLITGNSNTACSLLQRYIKKGLIKRVKRDLYVAINLVDGSPVVNEYVIASNITPGSYVSYHSAFSYYGFNNQFLFELYVSSPTKFNSFTFGGLKYRYIDSRMDQGIVTFPDGVTVTDMERTIIDSIDRFERIGGGMEELLECLFVVPSVDEDKLRYYLDCYGKKILFQKTGYMLEHFKDSMRLSPNFFNYCASNIGDSVRYLHYAIKYFDPVFNKRWQLYVPGNLLYSLGQGSEPNEFV